MMPTTRQVWRMPAAGSLSRLVLEEAPVAPPGPGEVQLRVEAVGLNFADLFACLGLYSATPAGAFIPGLELAGVIEALGPPSASSATTSPRLAVGERVMAVTRFGGYATRINLDARLVHPLPAGWTAAQGAAFPVQALTAWYALTRLARLAPRETVLVHSAAGGVGLQALAIVRTIGARAVATVGTAAKREFLVRHRGLDPSAVVVRDPRRFGAQLDAALAAVGAGGLDVVLDGVLGPFFRPAFERLRPEGRHVLFGAADFMAPAPRLPVLRLATRWLRRPRVDPLAMIAQNRALLAFNLIWLFGELERLPGAYRELATLVPDPPHVGAVIPFERAPEALRLLQGGRTIGKVVLQP